MMPASNLMLGGWRIPTRIGFAVRERAQTFLCHALYFASLHARLETAEFLVELGADVNQEVPGVNQLGGTVLHALTAGVPFGASADSHLSDERRIPDDRAGSAPWRQRDHA